MTARPLTSICRAALVAILGLALLGLEGPDPAAAGTAAAGTAEAGTADWRSVVAGSGHTCGIRTTGRLYCWGDDSEDQLGDGGTSTARHLPTEVDGGHTDWTLVSVSSNATCGRRSSGRLYCWGHGYAGHLGNGSDLENMTVPTEVAGGFTDWTTVSVGTDHTCGVRAGRLYCWGRDTDGLLGNGPDHAFSLVPSEVTGSRTDWASVSVGAFHSCARRTTGRLFCWGRDFAGQLGDGTATGPQQSPTQVFGTRTDWRSVSAGVFHTCATRVSGCFCWGANTDRQLGTGGTAPLRNTPVEVAGAHTDWTSVSTAGSHSCGRRRTGRIYCWGDDAEGKLGNGPATGTRPTPVQVAGNHADWTAVSGGWSHHACARRSSGRIFCWGNNNAGQLGTGAASVARVAPTQVQA